MLQFAVGFVITPRCRGGRSKPETLEIKNGLQALKKAKQRKEARTKGGKPINVEKRHNEQETHKSDTSELRWEHSQFKAKPARDSSAVAPIKPTGFTNYASKASTDARQTSAAKNPAGKQAS